ncbi:MAG: HAMP domain-containing sensor histidine kinase, partial [Polyangiaceae bacterium]
PVNAMDLHAQLLLRDKDLSQSSRDSVQQIRTEARHLNRMILNLLDLSKGDEGKLSPNRTDVDLPKLMTTITSELDANARSRKVGIQASLAVNNLHADEDLLRRALTNLIENALRHSPEQTSVIVTSERAENATDLRVRDFGKGISPEMREQIFDPFVQIATTDASSTRAGRGLGLTFCKLVAEAHSGTIDVDDAAPGAVFTMRFPNE